MKKLFSLFLILLTAVSACARPLPPEQLPPEAEITEIAPEEEFYDPPCGGLEDAAAPYEETVTKTAVEVMTGPGYGNDFVEILSPGTYTITEELTDEQGLLWGRLDSGKGWIDLTYSREITNVFGPITVADAVFGAEAHHTFIQDGYTDWGSHYRLTTGKTVTGLELHSCDFTENGPAPAEVLYRLDKLAADETLAVTLLFYGDMTAYALRYTDDAGNLRTCTMMHSGRDGSLILQEYTP